MILMTGDIMKCPTCDTEMNTLAKLSIDDVLGFAEDKFKGQKMRDLDEDRVTGYHCPKCGSFWRPKKEDKNGEK